AVACGAASTPGDSLDAITCAGLQSTARDEVAGAIEAHTACKGDADCTTVPLAASCFDACTRAASIEGKSAIDAAVAKVNGGQCLRFPSGGCRRAPVPPCAPRRPVSCKSGVCSD